MNKNILFTLLAMLSLSACSTISYGGSEYLFNSDATDAIKSTSSPSPVADKRPAGCKKKHGVVALIEQNQSNGMGGDSSGYALLRYLIERSGCFSVADRGMMLSTMENEAKIAGRSAYGSLTAPQYYLTPQLIYQEAAGGGGLTTSATIDTQSKIFTLGGFNVGISASATEVNVILMLTRADNGLQVASELGLSTKTDISMNSYGDYGGLSGSSVSAKAASAAYYDAYVKLVRHIESLSDDDAPKIPEAKPTDGSSPPSPVVNTNEVAKPSDAPKPDDQSKPTDAPKPSEAVKPSDAPKPSEATPIQPAPAPSISQQILHDQQSQIQQQQQQLQQLQQQQYQLQQQQQKPSVYIKLPTHNPNAPEVIIEKKAGS